MTSSSFTKWLWAIVGLVVLVFLIVVFSRQNPAPAQASSGEILQIVAGENFWGSLIAQLGGTKVNVLSVVSDPNADPHEYESNTDDARAIATANYVILNGAGYDSWGDKLLAESQNPNQKVLRVADLLGKKDGDNPHFWYSPTYVNEVVAQMEKDLIALDPNDTAYFQSQYQALQTKLAVYQSRINTIKTQFAGTKVAATESIFQYLSDAAGLDLVSPPEFIEAVAEGNDPPAQSIVEFQQQLKSGTVHVLVYNEQTVTPLTESIKKLAADEGIPVIGVTETIQPPDISFEDWMNSELINLTNALNAQALGQ